MVTENISKLLKPLEKETIHEYLYRATSGQQPMIEITGL